MPQPQYASPERYLSPQVARLEGERLWPRVWLMAGRVEQLPDVGDFLTFDIDRESILVLRTAVDTLQAFYNVCQHRGRRLKEGSGNTGRTVLCRFHGWRWTLEGALDRVVNREDWDAGGGLDSAALGLKPVRVDSWGGWIFVCMDPHAESLLEYLAPIPEILDPFELENCRMAWWITLTFPCNWKTVLNAFNENYHVETTHAQLNKYGLSKAPARALGRHAQFFVEAAGASANLGGAGNPRFADLIDTIEHREKERRELLRALVSDYGLRAVDRLRGAVPAAAPPAEIVAKYRQLHREEMEADGAPWPAKLTGEHIARAGIDLHIFPNMIVLPGIDGALHYRARPDPTNPESCVFDVWWIQRYGPGKAPKVQNVVYPSLEAAKGVNPFLEQDFGNLMAIQKGMHSRGFRGAVYNPVQETEILNFERVLDEYLARPAG